MTLWTSAEAVEIPSRPNAGFVPIFRETGLQGRKRFLNEKSGGSASSAKFSTNNHLQIILFNPAVQGRTRNSQFAGGFRNIALMLAQRFADDGLLYLFKVIIAYIQR